MTVSAADARTVDELLAFVLDGGQPDFLTFWGHRPPTAGGVGNGCLSQWWPVDFTVDGMTYPSAEHFMMAAKALLFGDSETADRIRQAPHPGAAKALGRRPRRTRSGASVSPPTMTGQHHQKTGPASTCSASPSWRYATSSAAGTSQSPSGRSSGRVRRHRGCGGGGPRHQARDPAVAVEPDGSDAVARLEVQRDVVAHRRPRARVNRVAEPLEGRLPGSAEHLTDLPPAMAGVAGAVNRVLQRLVRRNGPLPRVRHVSAKL
jgi:NADAR domain